jgi:hypothetical protein
LRSSELPPLHWIVMSDVTRLLEEVRQGDRAAWHQAVALVY